jgi:tetratricopeptide (TPR) repeat protein
MRLRSFRSSLLLGATLAGCADLELTNPNQPSTGSFWQTRDHAIAGINATYNGLLHNGTYGRWLVFATDLRSDIGRIQSPWPELSNFTKFTFIGNDYDFEVNREIWQHHYQAIFRANQVIAYVPAINMDAALRDRIVGEAKFIRALLYFNLVNLYENIPLITSVPTPTDRPATAEPAAVWAQIEQDLTDARGVLPPSYTGADVGRATSGAAAALLGKAHLQQREWAEAATALESVITSNRYGLVANYADNFTALNENNQESVFEVQFGDRALLSQGVRGINIARMVGPCGPSFCDGRPTRWYFEEFQTSRTATNAVDPRLDATLYYNGGTSVYNRTWDERYPVGSPNHNEIFFKKYGEYYLAPPAGFDQDWDAAINFRVIRYADVLLSYAEALNEQGQTGQAYEYVNRVRRRVGLSDIVGLSQAQLREAILRERMFEFGLEGQRWNDLRRHNLVNAVVEADAGTAQCTPRPTLAGCDAEFSFLTRAGQELLPIPQTETNLNPNVRQNPAWGGS